MSGHTWRELERADMDTVAAHAFDEEHNRTTELLPCPFCGGEAELHPSYDMDTNEVDGWFVWCNNKECECAPETREHFTEAEAIAAWNTRVPMSYEDVKILLDELGLSERTCSVVCFIEGVLMDEPNSVELSCGHTFETCDEVPPNYCPECGAKVVGE